METVKEKINLFTGIRSFRAEDMIWVIENGIKEFGLKAYGDDNLQELAKTREANGKCITGVVKDNIVGCGGIDWKWPGVAEVWLMLSYEVDKYPMGAYEVIKDGLGKLIKDNNLHRLEAHARIGVPEAHTLLRHLGFKIEGIARKLTPDKVDCISYAKVE